MLVADTRLGLVIESSSSTESCQNDSLPKASTERKGNGRDLARHGCLRAGGTSSPLWWDIGQAGTSIVVWIYPHNGRAAEGERKGNGRTTSPRHENPRAGSVFTINFTRITEGKRKGNGRGTEGIPNWKCTRCTGIFIKSYIYIYLYTAIYIYTSIYTSIYIYI